MALAAAWWRLPERASILKLLIYSIDLEHQWGDNLTVHTLSHLNDVRCYRSRDSEWCFRTFAHTFQEGMSIPKSGVNISSRSSIFVFNSNFERPAYITVREVCHDMRIAEQSGCCPSCRVWLRTVVLLWLALYPAVWKAVDSGKKISWLGSERSR